MYKDDCIRVISSKKSKVYDASLRDLKPLKIMAKYDIDHNQVEFETEEGRQFFQSLPDKISNTTHLKKLIGSALDLESDYDRYMLLAIIRRMNGDDEKQKEVFARLLTEADRWKEVFDLYL